MDKTSNKYWVLCVYPVLALTTLAVFWPVSGHEFLNYDDPRYVTKNEHVQGGLARENVIWAFTAMYGSGNWHPVTWLSHMLDCQLFGVNAGRHHLVNLLFHLANTLLLFAVLRRMTGAFWRCALVAGLFALHPLHVESVAWVAERKDVLSTFFWILTVWAYVRYAERGRLGRYALVLLFFCLGLMSKPMVVTLPFVLLLLDYWPLGRLRLGQPGGIGDGRGRRTACESSSVLRLVGEKVPLFLLASVSCVVTYVAQRGGGAITPIAPGVRVANAVVSYCSYIGKMIWPVNLAVLYPHRGMGPIWQIAAACLVLAGVSAVVILLRRSRPYLAVGWFWYVGMLVPVIGLVQVGSQAMADRYTYVPLVGLFIAIAWGLGDLVGRRRYQRFALGACAAAVLLVLAMCSRRQVGYWRNSITLFKHTLEAAGSSHAAHTNLAAALGLEGQYEEAAKHLLKLLEMNPKDAKAHYNLGLVLMLQNKLAPAVEHFEQVLRLKDDHLLAHLNMAVIMEGIGRLDEAIEHYEAALWINPGHQRARKDYNAALAKRSKEKEKEENTDD